MKLSNIALHIFIFFTLAGMANATDEYVFYDLKPKEYISEVLNDLGVCPLYGKDGYVSKILKINSHINPDKISEGQRLKIPYSSIRNIDDVLLFAGKKVVPKSINNNVCARLKKRKVVKKKIIELPTPTEEVVFKPVDVTPSLLNGLSAEELAPLEILTINLSDANSDSIDVNFNKPVITRGHPFIFVTLKKKKHKAFYHSGDGTSILEFKLKDAKNLSEFNSVEINIPKNYTDFEIVDYHDKPIKLERYKTILSKNEEMVPESSPPRVVKIIAPELKTYKQNDKIIFTLIYDKAIFVEGAPNLPLNLDGAKEIAKFKNIYKNSVNFEYEVSKSEVDTKKLSLTPELNFEEGSIYSNEGVKAESGYKITNEMIINLNSNNIGTEL